MLHRADFLVKYIIIKVLEFFNLILTTYKLTTGTRFKMDIKEYMSKRLDPQIKWYDEKAMQDQKYYKYSQLIEIVLASSIPLLAGYSKYNFWIPVIIGILGALIAIIESVTKLYRFHENWIQYRTTCELLKHQKHLYITNSFPYNTGEETIENIFIKNVENIMSSENGQWKDINSEKSKKK